MDKLKLIIEREFLAKVKNKSFIIMTFLTPIIGVAMVSLIVFLTKKNEEKVKEVVFVDESGLFSKEDFESTKSIKYEDYTKLGIEETKKKVEEGNHYGVVHIPQIDSLEILANSISFYSKESPGMMLVGDLEGKINKKLRNLKMTKLGVDIKKIEKSKISSNLKMFDFSGEESSKLINGVKIGIGFLAGYILMIFVLVYGQSVMRSVIEEKTSRIIEVIVSSVKPFQLMLGKIFGNASAGLLQFIIWGALLFIINVVASVFFGVSLTGMNEVGGVDSQQAAKEIAESDTFQLILKGVVQLPWLKIFGLFIFYFLFGFLLYSSIYAAIGSAVDNETDTQQFMMPIMLPLILGIYVGFTTVINDPHGPISVIFSYIPFTSPIVMLMRIPFGVAWWEILVSMFILVATFVFVVWVAAKIYRVGILMYGKKPTYKDLWKWIKYSA